jgi:hypothetical protein
MNSQVWLVAVASFLFLSQQANACECIVLTPSQGVEWADAILVAEVSNVEGKQATVLPIEVIKGKINQPLIFSIGHSNCDYFSIPDDVHVGDRHLFYLRLRDGKFNASICSRSGPLTKKGVELEELRKQFK